MELPGWKVIYNCEWYKNPRCIIPHTIARFLKPEHCAIVLRHRDSKVLMSLVKEDSDEYRSACSNSATFTLNEGDDHKIRFAHWFEETA